MQSFHAWGASRPWSWKSGLCGGTSLDPWTTSSCRGTSRGCSAWAWRSPTSAGTSTSSLKGQAAAPVWNGKSWGARTFRRFIAAARLNLRHIHWGKGDHRGHHVRDRQGPAAPQGLEMSTWRWPPEGTTESNCKANADSHPSQISSRWRRGSCCIIRNPLGSREVQLEPADDHLVINILSTPQMDMSHIKCIYVAFSIWLSTSSCSMGLKISSDVIYLCSQHKEATIVLVNHAQNSETVFIKAKYIFYKYFIPFLQLYTVKLFWMHSYNRKQAPVWEVNFLLNGPRIVFDLSPWPFSPSC